MTRNHKHSFKQNEEQQYQKYIGSNSPTYIDAWKQAKNPATFTGWNWSAFLFAPVWFGYRHMYGWATGYFLVSLLILLLVSFWPWLQFIGVPGPESTVLVSIIGHLAIHALVGIFGNAIYFRHIQRRIQLEHENKEKELQAAIPLFQAAGASRLAAMITTVTLIIVFSAPMTWAATYTYSPPLPEGVYLHLEDDPAPEKLIDVQDDFTFERYNATLQLLLVLDEPIGQESVNITIYKDDKQHTEQNYTYFSGQHIHIDLLDTDYPLNEPGEYNVHVEVPGLYDEQIPFFLE
ncbi:DUF2628 domain-containing protein [Texcoconibacillus texcoconensis]|uniref:DUF2628 domain-containing protein n=1 Tax=Texcoconibacillus texcoconensis TaxID=1095777 RepID=A0A840QSI0_9BACI|nr:DUF2628 domain-containing protein [Texcoconibacillus texcoconensis]MBB5174251.1 hypothetical protein [Texcoconibacillus texcoconensis]